MKSDPKRLENTVGKEKMLKLCNTVNFHFSFITFGKTSLELMTLILYWLFTKSNKRATMALESLIWALQSLLYCTNMQRSKSQPLSYKHKFMYDLT